MLQADQRLAPDYTLFLKRGGTSKTGLCLRAICQDALKQTGVHLAPDYTLLSPKEEKKERKRGTEEVVKEVGEKPSFA